MKNTVALLLFRCARVYTQQSVTYGRVLFYASADESVTAFFAK